MEDKIGTLYLIPSFLGFSDKALIPQSNLEIIHRLDEFVVENEKPARAFLKACETPIPMNDLILHPLNKHVDITEISNFLGSCEKGKDIGLLSDAGLPCIADPGYQIVTIAHAKGINVVPMHGLSSITLALMASGFTGQQFKFHGYLPHDKDAKHKVIKSMMADVKKNETQIFIETPYRNGAMIKYLKSVIPGTTQVCVAIDLTLPSQQILRTPLHAFPHDLDFLHKKPAVFLIGAE